MKFVIIGSSAAGISALETIRKYDQESRVTVVTADSARPHSRILTSYVIGDKIEAEDIFLRSPDYFAEMGAEIFARDKVEKINTEKKNIILSSGKKIFYDRLLITSGGSPKMPDYEGKELNGVFNLRDHDDANEIRDYLGDNIKHCFIFGGGLVGMKAAEAFYHLGKKVTIIIHSSQVLSQMLDMQAAALVEAYLAEKGINILTGKSVKRIIGNDRVECVELQSGEIIEGDLVLVGKGVKPNTDFIQNTVELNQYGGINVDEEMRSSDPNIYAAGDVVSAPDFLEEGNSANAIWPDAVWQGKVAAKNMIDICSAYEGGLNLNALKVIGLLFYAVGKVKFKDREREKYNIYVKNEAKNGIYRKLVFSEQKLVGAITIGQTNDIGVLYHLIKKKLPVEKRAEYILKNGINYAELIKDRVLLKGINRGVPVW